MKLFPLFSNLFSPSIYLFRIMHPTSQLCALSKRIILMHAVKMPISSATLCIFFVTNWTFVRPFICMRPNMNFHCMFGILDSITERTAKVSGAKNQWCILQRKRETFFNSKKFQKIGICLVFLQYFFVKVQTILFLISFFIISCSRAPLEIFFVFGQNFKSFDVFLTKLDIFSLYACFVNRIAKKLASNRDNYKVFPQCAFECGLTCSFLYVEFFHSTDNPSFQAQDLQVHSATETEETNFQQDFKKYNFQKIL